VSPLDAVLVINYLNEQGAGPSATARGAHSNYDVDDDGFVSPLDAVLIINSLNSSQAALQPNNSLVHDGEGEAPPPFSMSDLLAAAGDADFQSLSPRRRRIGP